jgi:hypothetical protein
MLFEFERILMPFFAVDNEVPHELVPVSSS